MDTNKKINKKLLSLPKSRRSLKNIFTFDHLRLIKHHKLYGFEMIFRSIKIGAYKKGVKIYRSKKKEGKS